MRRFMVVLAVAAVAVTGCYVQAVDAQSSTAKNAPPAWEYKIVDPKTFLDGEKINVFQLTPEKKEEMEAKVEGGFNRLGAEGWELCQEMNGALIFKRPKQ